MNPGTLKTYPTKFNRLPSHLKLNGSNSVPGISTNKAFDRLD